MEKYIFLECSNPTTKGPNIYIIDNYLTRYVNAIKLVNKICTFFYKHQYKLHLSMGEHFLKLRLYCNGA